MQISQPGAMAHPKTCEFGFTTNNSANNSIGNIGCEFLSQANWFNMDTLDLRINNILNDGIKQLIKYDWPSLSILRLGICLMFRLKPYREHWMS
jgi:hypothetical protein